MGHRLNCLPPPHPTPLPRVQKGPLSLTRRRHNCAKVPPALWSLHHPLALLLSQSCHRLRHRHRQRRRNSLQLVYVRPLFLCPALPYACPCPSLSPPPTFAICFVCALPGILFIVGYLHFSSLKSEVFTFIRELSMVPLPLPTLRSSRPH